MYSGPIILFDGVCNLCNMAVRFVIRHDPKAVFKFASLQSETGQTLLKNYKLPLNNFNSFILIEKNKAYTKSSAALKVSRLLKGPVKFLYIFNIVPVFIRDGVYNFISKKRYQWFGKKNECMRPSPTLALRFLI